MPAAVVAPRHTGRPPGGVGGYGGGDGGGDSGDAHREPRLRLTVYQIGVAVALVSITVFFAALAIAYSAAINARRARAPVVAVPGILWLSTGVILASSFVLERARKALRRGQVVRYRAALRLCLLLALAFLVCQFWACLQLQAQGVYIRANPAGSVVFAFTGFHGLHLLGGIAWLAGLHLRARRLATESELRKQRLQTGAAAWYWHFLGLLWVVLFALLYSFQKSSASALRT